MITVFKNVYKNKKFNCFLMVTYVGRNDIHTHNIKGVKEKCEHELQEIVFNALKGNYCRYIGNVYNRLKELERLEDVENINFLYEVAEWMVEKLEFEGERTITTLSKQIKKIENRLKSIIGLFKELNKMPFEFLNLIELCDQVLEGYVSSIFKPE